MKKIITLLISLLFVFLIGGTVSFAAAEGRLTVKPKIVQIEGGQKGSVRVVYNGPEIDGLFFEMTYPAEIATMPVMSFSIPGVQCEIADNTIKVIYLDSGTPLNENGELYLCDFDFEVSDEAAPGSTLKFELKTALASVSVNELPSTVEPVKKSEPFIIMPAAEGNRLAAVEIMGGTITPEFSPYIRNYEVAVPSSVGRVTIEAAAQNPQAVVEGTGTMSLYRRKHTLTVTNPDGESFEYNFTFSLDNYRKYSNSVIWNFVSDNGLYIAILITVFFAAASVLKIRRQHGEGKEKKDEE